MEEFKEIYRKVVIDQIKEFESFKRKHLFSNQELCTGYEQIISLLKKELEIYQ